MNSKVLLGSTFFIVSIFQICFAVKFNETSDLLPGDYCSSVGCCDNRQDECSVPILGTRCYCDEFCDKSRVEDCCPDFWLVCKNIRPPPPPSPPQQIITCTHKNGEIISVNGTIKDNCNICKCEKISQSAYKVMCETNACLVDPNLIDTINRRYEWTASNYSKFWGRTLDEGLSLRLGTLPPQRAVKNMNPVKRMYDPSALPREFDTEAHWPNYISGVQDQGWCGSSWAISTAAVASDRFAIISNGLEGVQLSPQNLLSCDTRGQQSCKGGHLDKAWAYIRKFGLVDENCFPYVAFNEKCRIGRREELLKTGCAPPPYKERKSRYSTGPAYRLGNETDIMHEMTKSGPVQATMRVYRDFFSYRGGIYTHSVEHLNEKFGYHSVRIVGWGEVYNGAALQKYWKVANSWGPEWGENGYFRIAKGTDESEIESFVLATWPDVERKILMMRQNLIY